VQRQELRGRLKKLKTKEVLGSISTREDKNEKKKKKKLTERVSFSKAKFDVISVWANDDTSSRRSHEISFDQEQLAKENPRRGVKKDILVGSTHNEVARESAHVRQDIDQS